MSFMLIAAILAAFGLMALATVALAAGLSILPMQKIRSFAMTLLWIVPAVGIVGMIGFVPHANHGAAHSNKVNFHKDIQRSVERRWISNSGKAAPPGPAAVPIVVTTDVVSGGAELTAEAELATNELADLSALPASLTDDRAAIVETTSKNLARNAPPDLALAPVPPASDMPPKFPEVALTGTLKVRETRSQPPDWAGKDPISRGESVLVPLSSQMWATMGEAERQVTQRAAQYVKVFFRDEYPIRGDFVVPVPVVEKTAVNSLVGEEIEKDFGGDIGKSKMYRAHLLLDVGPSLRTALHDSWRNQVVDHRLKGLASLFGLATLALATAAGFFRLDDATNGQYRRRLKFAAAALIAAGSLVAWQVVA